MRSLRGFTGLAGSMPVLLLATVFLNLLSLALPLALLQVYDRIIPNSSTGTLLLLVAGVAAALVCETVLRLARSAITGWIGARFEHRAGVAAFGRLLNTPQHVLEREGTGVHLERMAALPMIKDHYAEQGLTTLLDMPFVVLFLGLVWVLAGTLVLVPLGMVALFALLMLREARGLRRAMKDYNTVRDRRLSFNIEVLNGVHSVKSMAMEGQMMQRYARLQEAVARANHGVVMHNAVALGMSGLFSQLVMIGIAAYGSTFVVANELTVGGLAACTLLAGRAMQPLQRAVALWTRLQGLKLAEERAEQIFRLPQNPVPEAPYVAVCQGAVELRDVHYGYDGGEKPLFGGISLRVEPGECVGISGTNGSGKSSLLGLIRGTLAPTSGQVLIDDVPVSQWDPRSLAMEGIGYLPSEAALFRGTLLDNLTMFRKELRRPALDAAHLLGLDEVVATMPQGFLTKVPDGASDAMPRGIRQRIAVARVLALRPRIILFDEANTAMDGAGDERLRQALEGMKGSTTMILVTLRPSLLKLAERRFEIAGGTLRERQDPSLSGRAPAAPVPGEAAEAAGRVLQ